MEKIPPFFGQNNKATKTQGVLTWIDGVHSTTLLRVLHKLCHDPRTVTNCLCRK